MATVTKPIVLDETMKELLSMIDGVKSVNGLTGVVVLDGNNIKLHYRNADSQTLAQAFEKAGRASVEQIGETDDYVLTVINGTIT